MSQVCICGFQVTSNQWNEVYRLSSDRQSPNYLTGLSYESGRIKAAFLHYVLSVLLTLGGITAAKCPYGLRYITKRVGLLQLKVFISGLWLSYNPLSSILWLHTRRVIYFNAGYTSRVQSGLYRYHKTPHDLFNVAQIPHPARIQGILFFFIFRLFGQRLSMNPNLSLHIYFPNKLLFH